MVPHTVLTAPPSGDSANIVSVPFRRSTQVSLTAAIRQYITSKYDQHPDMFEHDLEVMDALRRDAVNVREAHPSGVRKLQAYAAQLVWVSGKFPPDIGTEFTWYPSLGYNTERPISRNDIRYDLANVLYNLAALYSQLAVASNRSTTEGLKAAASYFAQSAGVLQHIRDVVVPELRELPPDDMDTHTLESLLQLQLAQAQECFWQKAVMDGYKDGSVAKLAARVSDLYNLAGETAMKSEAISSAWIHHMSAKHHHFAAAAQYRAARDCLEKRRYGEEVARLKDAIACINEGLREVRGGYISQAVVDDLRGIKDRVEEDLKRAERDNDIIYLQAVPPKSELKILDRANMAVAKCPPQVSSPLEYLGDRAEFGPPLFAKLVPFAVHLAVTVYEERRDRLVNGQVIQELDALNTRVHEALSALNLPGSIQALERPLGLPASLVQHAEEVRQADAAARIRRSFADIERLRAEDLVVFDEAKSLLEAEADEDDRLRRRFGTERWTRPDGRTQDENGRKLWQQVSEIEGYLASSASSDQVVRDKFSAVEDSLAILASPDRVIADHVPSSRRTEVPEALKPYVARLRSAYNDVTRLEARRRRRAEALREKARHDTIKHDILQETARLERAYPNTQIAASHFENFFTRRLAETYAEDQELVIKETAEQERLLAEVEKANREFEEAQRRAGADRSQKEREAVLQRLENAYYKYKETVSNVEVGRKFYNDLNKIVVNFRDQARMWVQMRRREAKLLEESVIPQVCVKVIRLLLTLSPQRTVHATAVHTEPQLAAAHTTNGILRHRISTGTAAANTSPSSSIFSALSPTHSDASVTHPTPAVDRGPQRCRSVHPVLGLGSGREPPAARSTHIDSRCRTRSRRRRHMDTGCGHQIRASGCHRGGIGSSSPTAAAAAAERKCAIAATATEQHMESSGWDQVRLRKQLQWHLNAKHGQESETSLSPLFWAWRRRR